MVALPASIVSQRRTPLWRTILGTVLRGVLATLFFVVSVMMATGLAPVTQSATRPDPAKALLGLLGMGVMYSIALGYPVMRSRWTRWKTVVALFVAYAGVTPLLLQIESLVFLVILVPVIPVPALQIIVLHGLVSALLFTPLVVLVFGKIRGKGPEKLLAGQVGWSPSEWAWKLLLIGLVYNAIYFTFGRLVAVPLAGPAFDEYYRDLQVPSWLPLLQLARGAFWALFMVPVIRMVGGRWWEAGLAVALLSSFLTSAPLLNQNDFMPDAMRFAHFFELLTSNFLFGWAIFWLFHRHHDSPRQLAGGGAGSGEVVSH